MTPKTKLRLAITGFMGVLVILIGAFMIQPASAAVTIAGFNCTKTDKANGGFILDCDPPTTPPTQTPTATPTVQPTTVPPTTPPPTTPPPGPFSWTPPTQSDTGVPAGWVPTTTRGTWNINTPGTYVDTRVNGDVNVNVPGVTLRRVEVIGGSINNETATGCNQMTLDHVTVRTSNGQAGGSPEGAIGPGGYTAMFVSIMDTIEGFRVGGKSVGCGPVSISDSYIRVKDAGNCDLHADGIQGYDGNALTVRRVTSYFAATCGTAAYFYPSNQGNTSADVDKLYVWGPGVGFTFRMGTPGRVANLLIGNQWVYGPIDVRCSLLTSWHADIVSVGSNGQPLAVTRANQPCNTESG